jgi:DNA polymerase III epsilon subunit-like protein
MNTNLSPYHADPDEFARFVTLHMDTTEFNGETRIVQIIVVDITESVKANDLEVESNLIISFINPECSIRAIDTFRHGVSNKDVDDAPTFKEYGEQVRQYIGDATIIGHGVSNEMAILNTEFARIGVKQLRSPYICTLALAKKTLAYFKNYKYKGNINSVASLIDFLVPKYGFNDRYKFSLKALYNHQLYYLLNLLDTKAQYFNF